MSYRGERIGVVLGAEVRRLTDAERASRGGKGGLWRIVGHSHWCPDWFFAQRVDELEQELAIARAAAFMIEEDAEELADLERRAVPGCPTESGQDPTAAESTGIVSGSEEDDGDPCDEWPAWATAIVSGESLS